jgi:hypothetical protein
LPVPQEKMMFGAGDVGMIHPVTFSLGAHIMSVRDLAEARKPTDAVGPMGHTHEQPATST